MNAKTIIRSNCRVAKRTFQRTFSKLDRVGGDSRKRINRVCPGYSTAIHWRFFKMVMERYRPSRAAIAGVFHGRDCAYVSHLSKSFGDPEMTLTGVDLFSDGALPDWAPEQLGETWEANGFGSPPHLGRTMENLQKLGLDDRIELVRRNAIDFFADAEGSFDFIYIDTSHDYQTTFATISAALPRLARGGVIAGDDYLDFGMWGVRSAVSRILPSHRTFGSDFIWYSDEASGEGRG